MGYNNNSPGCEGDVADEETGLRRRPTVTASVPASAGPGPAVTVPGVIVALAPRRAPAVPPPRAVAPTRTPTAISGHHSSGMPHRTAPRLRGTTGLARVSPGFGSGPWVFCDAVLAEGS